MGVTGTWMQGLRIPVVVALLMITGLLTRSPALRGLELDAMWRAWVPLVLAGTVTAALIVVARDGRIPSALLVAELMIAGVIGFVPPVLWIYWFGFAGIAALFASSPVGFVQPLAVVWFVTATATLVRQRRGRIEGPVEERVA